MFGDNVHAQVEEINRVKKLGSQLTTSRSQQQGSAKHKSPAASSWWKKKTQQQSTHFLSQRDSNRQLQQGQGSNNFLSSCYRQDYRSRKDHYNNSGRSRGTPNNLNLRKLKSSTPLPHIPVGGRLRFFLDEWKKFTSDPFILDMVSGMSLDLTDIPLQESLPHEIKMNAVETAAAERHIKELLQKGAIKPSTFNPQTDFLSNIFLTPKPDGLFCCILNLKNFNQFLEFAHFKMENLQLILDFVTPLCWMCVFDLSDAYLMLP